jgi:hypothetical protein
MNAGVRAEQDARAESPSHNNFNLSSASNLLCIKVLNKSLFILFKI